MEIRSIRKIKKANNRAHNFGESVIQRAAVSGEELLSLHMVARQLCWAGTRKVPWQGNLVPRKGLG